MTSTLLDEEDKSNINTALAAAEALRPDITRARQAGLDVAKREEDLEKSISRLRAIKAAFDF